MNNKWQKGRDSWKEEKSKKKGGGANKTHETKCSVETSIWKGRVKGEERQINNWQKGRDSWKEEKQKKKREGNLK